MRKAYLVYVDLDETPGNMHTEASAMSNIYAVLCNSLYTYNPKVYFAPDELQTEKTQGVVMTDQIILKTKEEADKVLEALSEYMTTPHDELATKADLNDLLGLDNVYTDHQWGWTSMEGFDAIPDSEGGWELIVPPPKKVSEIYNDLITSKIVKSYNEGSTAA